MGKKSRRANRNKPKDIPAANSTAVAAPRQVAASATDVLVDTFSQLCNSQDWAGMLELESKMSAIVKTVESSQPRPSGVINFNLGAAHKEMGREGGIEQATALVLSKSCRIGKEGG